MTISGNLALFEVVFTSENAVCLACLWIFTGVARKRRLFGTSKNLFSFEPILFDNFQPV